MRLMDIVLYAALIGLALYVTRVNNIWGLSKGTKKARLDLQKQQAEEKKRKQAMKLNHLYTWVSHNLGFTLSPVREADYKYRIERLNIECKGLKRNYKPVEIHGQHKIIQYTGVFLFILTYVITSSPVCLLLLVTLFMPTYFKSRTTKKIEDLDMQLERDFPDFYNTIYSKLLQGTRSRIAPTVTDYIMSLDKTKDNSFESTAVVRQFALDLRNNIDLYGDDSLAVNKLRDKYNSVMVVNFCNLATQALRGVDNKDKLLGFKLELQAKQAAYMEERADRMVRQGQRAIWAIYLILAQFVLLSWYAKFAGTTGGAGAVFGGE